MWGKDTVGSERDRCMQVFWQQGDSLATVVWPSDLNNTAVVAAAHGGALKLLAPNYGNLLVSLLIQSNGNWKHTQMGHEYF